MDRGGNLDEQARRIIVDKINRGEPLISVPTREEELGEIILKVRLVTEEGNIIGIISRDDQIEIAESLEDLLRQAEEQDCELAMVLYPEGRYDLKLVPKDKLSDKE